MNQRDYQNNYPQGVGAPNNNFKDFEFKPSTTPRLTGKSALITGAGIGIGKGIALELAKEGVEVAIHYYNEGDIAKETERMILEGGGKVHLIKADFSSTDAAAPCFNHTMEALGKIDILVNNAGITANIPFSEVTGDFFDRLMNVNVRTPYFLTQEVVQVMKQQQAGTIINLSSLHSNFAFNEHTVYAMTKAAIVAWTRNLALELAPSNIRVNAISPGWSFGENHLKALGNADLTPYAADIPAGYISVPNDIGRLAVHLCLPEFNYFVGQNIIFDGGQSCILPNTGSFNKPSEFRWGKDYLG